jgi:SAM-dependent methyltransferase
VDDNKQRLVNALWRIYNRPERPAPWVQGGNLPWDNPAFSERMLREHLDETHGAASRTTAERQRQLAWLTGRLPLKPDDQVLDVTCGPGLYAVALAEQGCQVTGVDFSPASIRYARELAERRGVAGRCTFIEQDVRQMDFTGAGFDAALFIYGQLAVFERDEAQRLLAAVARALRPGGRLCLELLNPAHTDRSNSNWWFTDERGLWGDGPFLHLGERFWLVEEEIALERFYTIHLETGRLDEVILCDQAYPPDVMGQMLLEAGFESCELFPAWDDLALSDAAEWLVYLATRAVDK